MPEKPTSSQYLVLAGVLLLGAVVAYIDHTLNLHTMLVESLHILITTGIFIFCLRWQKKYPEIRQYGWPIIIWGLGLLALGSWIDLLDDPPTLHWLNINGIPFGRSWQQAFLKKILGYTVGVGLLAYGLFQWIPWMITTRMHVERLNNTLTTTTKRLNRIQMGLEEHIESERLHISRELHDDVAQQLTYLTMQVQLLQKEADTMPDAFKTKLKELGQEISSVLKNVRQISQNLRPESIYSLGVIAAMEQFIDKIRQQHPETTFNFSYTPADANTPGDSLDSWLSDRERLHVFRIIQEATRNTIKHGKAKTVDVSITEKKQAEKNTLLLSITDDGLGLPWQDVPSDDVLLREGHLGIVGLRERIKELSADFRLKNKDNGALLEVEITR